MFVHADTVMFSLQQQVDKAKDFSDVFKEFEEWMTLHKLGTEHKFAILTDGYGCLEVKLFLLCILWRGMG